MTGFDWSAILEKGFAVAMAAYLILKFDGTIDKMTAAIMEMKGVVEKCQMIHQEQRKQG